MKAAIFNPYFDTLGGGERYCASVAQTFIKEGYKTDIQWNDKNIIEKINSRFGIDLGEAQVVDDVKKGDGYDVIFWVSDGSIPLLRSRINLLHFQVPFSKVNGGTLFNRMKMSRINSIVCNSKFTKNVIDKEYKTDGIVVYPPVDVEKFVSRRKKNIILSVGRFSQLKQAKRQDILIKGFKRLIKTESDWELILAGGVEVGAEEYVTKLKKQAKNYPIKIVQSPNFKELVKLYGQAKIFWTASGFGINEKKEPEKVEHFGISLVEAMAAGCVPVAYSAGGHKEIIDDKNGLLWNDISSLVANTKKLIKDNKLRNMMFENAIESSKIYSVSRFEGDISKLL